MPYGFAICGCPISERGTDHVKGCRGGGFFFEHPPPPPPPPIVAGSCVRAKSGYNSSVGLPSGDIYTVERVEDRGGGKVYVYLVGDARPWKIERFEAVV
jgi:hypothetical protein